MTVQTYPHPRGRPRRDAAWLSRERILAAATQQIAAGAGDVNMRALAQGLGVRPMALYHYFSDKQALKQAMVEQAFAPLFALRPRLVKRSNAEDRLRLLATTYLRCAATALPLTRHLAARDGAPLVWAFSALFGDALGTLATTPAGTALRDVLVDYLHGAALAGPRNAARALDAGWPLLMEGVRRYLPQQETIGKIDE